MTTCTSTFILINYIFFGSCTEIMYAKVWKLLLKLWCAKNKAWLWQHVLKQTLYIYIYIHTHIKTNTHIHTVYIFYIFALQHAYIKKIQKWDLWWVRKLVCKKLRVLVEFKHISYGSMTQAVFCSAGAHYLLIRVGVAHVLKSTCQRS